MAKDDWKLLSWPEHEVTSFDQLFVFVKHKSSNVVIHYLVELVDYHH